ncbi:MAG: hypothetical protein R2824_11675 [Saprospiraceae bacterium]
MKNNLILFTLVLLGFFTMSSQCKKEQLGNEKNFSELVISLDQTAWFCAEKCRYNFTFTDGQVTTERYNAPNDETPLWTCTRKLAAADWQKLVATFDKDALSGVEETIGCPGCADEPIETVKVSTAQFEHAVRMNIGTAIPAVQPLLDELRSQAEAYKDQENCE